MSSYVLTDTNSYAPFLVDTASEITVEKPRKARPTRTYTYTYRWQWSVERWENVHRNQLKVAEYASVDDLAMPGEAVTASAINHRNKTDSLVSVIQRLATDGLSWNFDHSAKINKDTANAASVFFWKLGAAFIHPKIAPDGEGALIAVWNRPEGAVLLTVENWKLHMVVGAGTAGAQYIDAVNFDGNEVPQEIREHIPNQ